MSVSPVNANMHNLTALLEAARVRNSFNRPVNKVAGIKTVSQAGFLSSLKKIAGELNKTTSNPIKQNAMASSGKQSVKPVKMLGNRIDLMA